MTFNKYGPLCHFLSKPGSSEQNKLDLSLSGRVQRRHSRKVGSNGSLTRFSRDWTDVGTCFFGETKAVM